jgi:AcrR family transcriptional regulator
MATVPARLTAADRREQILAVATTLFARQGFQGTTTRQIAERAGVTEALVFRHFRTKEDLYWAVIEAKIQSNSAKERLRAGLKMSGTDAEILAALAQEILEGRAKDQTLSRLLLYSALENHRLSHRFFGTFVAGYYEVLADYIQRRTKEGIFREVDPLLAARGFLGMLVYHSWVQDLFGGRRYQDLSVQHVSRTLADLWLQGMLRPTGANGTRKRRNGNHSTSEELNRVAQS